MEVSFTLICLSMVSVFSHGLPHRPGAEALFWADTVIDNAIAAAIGIVEILFMVFGADIINNNFDGNMITIKKNCNFVTWIRNRRCDSFAHFSGRGQCVYNSDGYQKA